MNKAKEGESNLYKLWRKFTLNISIDEISSFFFFMNLFFFYLGPEPPQKSRKLYFVQKKKKINSEKLINFY